MKVSVSLTLLVLTPMLGGCLSASQPNASGFTSQQQGYYNFFISDGFSKEKATLFAVSPEARQLYFDDKKCLSYGAKPGSDAYVACRAQLEAASKSQPAPAIQSSGGGGYYAAAPVPTSDAPVLQNIIPPSVRCQSVPAGMGTVQTICR